MEGSSYEENIRPVRARTRDVKREERERTKHLLCYCLAIPPILTQLAKLDVTNGIQSAKDFESETSQKPTDLNFIQISGYHLHSSVLKKGCKLAALCARGSK